MYDKSQLMRGTLEGCILKFLSEETTYGYELVERLEQNGFQDIKEGTIYPLLVRLEKRGSSVPNFDLPRLDQAGNTILLPRTALNTCRSLPKTGNR